MYSGFVLPHKTFTRIGTHQRVDLRARRLLNGRISPDFPSGIEIVRFEGMEGPDGLNIRSGPVNHLWNPKTDEGFVGKWIEIHYDRLVVALRNGQRKEAAFEAAWLAHYIADADTPVHHHYFDWFSLRAVRAKGFKTYAQIRKFYSHWYPHGEGNKHMLYEIGMAFLSFNYAWDEEKYRHARELGILPFIREQAIALMDRGLLEQYQREGWTKDLIEKTKQYVLPQAVLDTAIAWKMADDAAHEIA